tara:strand:+ start:276 stop:1598 length:1323 start_codon:yes stop_codon:yes gene_type:complete
MKFFNLKKNTLSYTKIGVLSEKASSPAKYYLILYAMLIVSFFLSTMMISIEDKPVAVNEKSEDRGTILKEKFLNNLRSPYLDFKYVIKNNDSIQGILKKFNIRDDEINVIIDKLKEKKLTNIYTGRELYLIAKKGGTQNNSLVSLNLPINNTLSIEIKRNKNDFVVEEKILQLTKKEVVKSGKIKESLYSAAVRAGIEPNIIIEFARIYGFEIDFQRDIRKGDVFEVYYEKFVDHRNEVKDTGKIIYASMNVNNREINLYNFNWDKESGFYDLNGKSIVKSLMKTPINGARLSSSYGMRKHPILGFNKMHRGTDFAAPTGTPIMASGSGTVTRARWCGGGGNCVKIRHNSTYETIYAHMSKFAKGVKEGRKVRQGQIIGYVGSTGLSTGPHLHYEVHVNKKSVNSQTLRLPSGKILKGEARKEFEIERIKIDLKLAELKK